MGISEVISLLGGVAMFLFGMALMGDSLKKVAGARLEVVLYKLTGSPIKGVLLGTGVTAVIQSSSATSVMTVGFVNAGVMGLGQAVGIILGAFLGTSVTGWIICLSDLGGGAAGTLLSLFSTATLTALTAIIGILIRMTAKKQTTVHTADILLGFAVLMFGMSTMSASVEPLRESEAFLRAMTRFSNPILGILAGAAFTAIIQSSSAAVGILQALAATGTISFSVAAPVIMGIAIGAAVPVMLSAVGSDTEARRSAMVYPVIDVVGVAACSILLYGLNAVLHFPFMDRVMTSVTIAELNTLFRLITVVLLLPAIGSVERLLRRLIPDKPDRVDKADLAVPDRLEERFLAHPALAIEQSREAAKDMAIRAQDNLVNAMELLKSYRESEFKRIEEAEDTVDRYEDRLGTYLVKLTRLELTDRQTADVSKFLHTIGDFERLSDHALNIAEAAKEIHTKQVVFSPAAAHELSVTCAAVGEIVSLAMGAFLYNDLELAMRVEPLEELIDGLCDEMKLHHVQRLEEGSCTLEHGFVFNDLQTNLERVADHCSNIAVAMIELEGKTFDTHEYIKSLQELHGEEFRAAYAAYSEKFRF